MAVWDIDPAVSGGAAGGLVMFFNKLWLKIREDRIFEKLDEIRSDIAKLDKKVAVSDTRLDHVEDRINEQI